MNNVIKITDVELMEIKTLQGKFQETVFKLGNLQIEKMNLDAAVNAFVEREKNLKTEWASLQGQERILLDNIVKKYGEGNLNMNDGTFTPTTAQVPTGNLPQVIQAPST